MCITLHCCQLRLPRQRQQCGLDAADCLTALWNFDREQFFCCPEADTRERPLLVVKSQWLHETL